MASSAMAGPTTHDLILLPSLQVSTGQVSSDYESASSISTTSIEACAKITKQRTCCSVSFNRFKQSVKIKRKFIPSKLSYFFFFSSRSILATYFIVFMANAGLDPEQIGLIQGMRMILLTTGGMFWAMLADKSNKDLLIISIELCGFTTLMFCKPWVAYWMTSETTSEHREHVHHAVVDILTTAGNGTEVLSEAMLNHSNKEISEMFGLNWSVKHYKAGSTPLFVSMLVIGVVSAFLGGGIQILLDARVMKFSVAASKNKSTYGRQRLWGSVAYSISPVLCGVVLESLPESKISPYMPVFYILVGFMVLSLASFFVLFRQELKPPLADMTAVAISGEIEHGHNTNEESIGRFLIKTIRNLHMSIFLFNALCVGVANGLQWSFQFIYLSEMNATKTAMGLCSMTQCAAEAITFSIASKINKRIGGNKIATTIGIFGYAVTFMIFFFARTPIVMILTTPIIGFCFTLFYTGSMDELHKASTPKCMTSLHACFNGILSGIGNALAGIVGGMIYKKYGGEILFLSAALACLFIGIMNIFYSIVYQRTPLTNHAKESYKPFLDIYIPVEPSTTETRLGSDDAISLVIDDDNKF